jgi:divalent metal cation (Fe/Co/Zn/Cd) transporter
MLQEQNSRKPIFYETIKVGSALNSRSILSDAACSRTYLILSVILLAASLCYEITGLGGIDSLGSVIIAWLSYKEGREAFEKAGGAECNCGAKC